MNEKLSSGTPCAVGCFSTSPHTVAYFVPSIICMTMKNITQIIDRTILLHKSSLIATRCMIGDAIKGPRANEASMIENTRMGLRPNLLIMLLQSSHA